MTVSPVVIVVASAPRLATIEGAVPVAENVTSSTPCPDIDALTRFSPPTLSRVKLADALPSLSVRRTVGGSTAPSPERPTIVLLNQTGTPAPTCMPESLSTSTTIGKGSMVPAVASCPSPLTMTSSCALLAAVAVKLIGSSVRLRPHEAFAS